MASAEGKMNTVLEKEKNANELMAKAEQAVREAEWMVFLAKQQVTAKLLVLELYFGKLPRLNAWENLPTPHFKDTTAKIN